MNFILFSHTQIGANPSVAGHTQYPYDLVLKACQPVLERLGRVHVVQSTAEVDPLYRQLQEQGQDGLFLSFAPVHETAADLRCPTLCVVAWEFDSIPDEPWDDDPAHDWRQLLGRHGRAITLSEHTAGTVRKAMGEDFPILVLPAMQWPQLADQPLPAPVKTDSPIQVKGCLLDTRTLGLSVDSLLPELPVEITAQEQARLDALLPPPLTPRRRVVIARHYLRLWLLHRLGREVAPSPSDDRRYLGHWYWEGVRDLLPDTLHQALAKHLPSVAAPLPVPEPQVPVLDLPDTQHWVQTDVSGVVYVSTFNPQEGQNNWPQLISAFCWAFRDTADATLILRIEGCPLAACYTPLLTVLTQLSPFSCRVVVMYGELDAAQQAQLQNAASFYVNASRAEAVCLPLMAFMAGGVPAIAPAHSALGDYIDDSVAFVVPSSEEPALWPHDTRQLNRTRRHRPDWGALKNAFQASYRLARTQPDAYAQMAAAAQARMQAYCAVTVLQQRAAIFFNLPLADEPATAAARHAAEQA